MRLMSKSKTQQHYVWLWRLMQGVSFLLLVPLAADAFTSTTTTITSWLRATPGSSMSLLYAQKQQLQGAPVLQRNFVILSHNVSQAVVDGLWDINNLLKDRVDVLARCVNAALWVSNGIRTNTIVYLQLAPHNISIRIDGAHVQNLNPDERTMALYLQRTLLSSSEDNDNDNSKYSGDFNIRRDQELIRLQERKLQKPTTINPFKPGSLPKSEKGKLRAERKLRQAAARRLKKNCNNMAAAPPSGFTRIPNDTIGQRLEECSALGPVLMLNEQGESLMEALLPANTDDADDHKPSQSSTAVTFILGNQLGYIASDEQLMMGHSVRPVSLGPVSLLTSQCITIAHNHLDIAEAVVVEAATNR